ncbi:unnamed protein product [Paramecium primaurelia]|uniref:Uncharacterized protein n=1 Tax=Paramecium primaurelia TaxID=5886 RepID=A0A8S1JRA5_PARPR|nr:unnamed protein product [Paramecium primaurelia]
MSANDNCQDFNTLDEQHKQQMMQLETMGMMCKYQMIFTKMDAALLKIASILRQKQNNDKSYALFQIKDSSINQKQSLMINALSIAQRMKLKLNGLFNFCEKHAQENQFVAFHKIYIISKARNQEQKLKEENEKQKKEFLFKLNQKDEDIDRQRKKNEELEGILYQQKQRESDCTIKLQQKMKLIQRYESDLLELKRQPSSTKNSNQENRLKELENNNAILSLQIQQNSQSLINFVKEMNELLDSHSFILNEKNISSFRAKYK